MTRETEAVSDALADDFHSRQPTLYENCQITLHSWTENAEEAKRFGEGVGQMAHGFSRYLDLSRLESIVLSSNYREALASVTRGDGMPPAVPTANEYGEGGAMAVHVIRDDELWNIVVIWAPLVRCLLEPEHEGYKLALHTFFHELIHVHELRKLTRTYPGGWKAAQPRDGREVSLVPIVNACQSEYCAQRGSAALFPEYGLDLLEMLGNAMNEADEQIRSARMQYRVHGNMAVYWPEVVRRLTFLFQAIGYGLGHADWVQETRDERPELAALYDKKLKQIGVLPNGWLLDACRQAVQPFFDQKEWRGLEVYDPLLAVLEKLLNQYRMFTRPEGDKIFIDMPYIGLHDL